MNNPDKKNLILVCALLIHAAKMDENYTDKEKSIILRALTEISEKKEFRKKEKEKNK